MGGVLQLASLVGAIASWVWVGGDAGRRGRNGFGWGLLAAATFPFGLISWLLVRQPPEQEAPAKTRWVAAAVVLALGAAWVLVRHLALLDPWTGLDTPAWQRISDAATGILVLAYGVGFRARLHPMLGLLLVTVGALGAMVELAQGGVEAPEMMSATLQGLLVAFFVAVLSATARPAGPGDAAPRNRWGLAIAATIAVGLAVSWAQGASRLHDPAKLTLFIRNLGPHVVNVTLWPDDKAVSVPCGVQVAVPAGGSRQNFPWRLQVTSEGGTLVWDWAIDNNASIPLEVRGTSGPAADRVLVSPSVDPPLARLVPTASCS